LFRSIDGGANWQRRDGDRVTALPDLPAHSAAVDPANADNIFVGTDAGIFASFDAGRTWAKEDAGFANALVESTSIVRENNVSTLYALTHGRGAWAVVLDGGQPAACSFQFDTPAAQTAYPGTLRVPLETSPDCTWSVVPNSSWTRATTSTGKGSATSVSNSISTCWLRRERASC